MTDLMIQSLSPRNESFTHCVLDGYRTIVPRCARVGDAFVSELKHSKSDDLTLQSPPVPVAKPDIKSSRCDSPLHVSSSSAQKDDVPSTVFHKPKYYSDSETDLPVRTSHADRSCKKVSKDLSSDVQRYSNRHQVNLYDQVDPEDSIRDMITENDFYRFVLFKRHYDNYLDLSQKYEEARNIAYYLEEKYHEIKAERDGLTRARMELERKLESRNLEIHEKEEELFMQLEKVVRLEEDCEKLREEKEKFEQWKNELEREKNEAYRLLKRQAVESEATRRGLERARQEVVRQVTAISAEKDILEKENAKLKETLKEERKGVGHYLVDLSQQKKRISQNVVGLEKEVSELKFMARQSASLNNQFKKGMKHLATCKRKKCSVCTYTRTTFGEYADRNDKKLLSCFQAPLQDLRKWIRPVPLSASCSEDEGASHYHERERTSSALGYATFLGHSSPLPSTRSEYSFRRAYSSESPSPTPSFPPRESSPEQEVASGPYISYIDEASSDSSSDSGNGEEYNVPPCHCSFNGISVPTDTSLTSTSTANPGARAFSSDSGFSSELYDTGRRSLNSTVNKTVEEERPAFQRSKWTSSFRKLINRVSKR